MRRLLDRDPISGLENWFHYDDQTDTTTIETTQDVSGQLEFAKAMRNDPEFSKKGIKKGQWLYAHIPDIIQLKMLNEDGVDILNPDHAKKMGELIETKYPNLKLTYGKHKIKG